MINKDEARIEAWLAISKLFGNDYFRSHFNEAWQSYSTEDDENEFEYFIGFEGVEDSPKWKVFARVLVNRENKTVTFLDYKTPDGTRMQNPIKPTSFA